MLWITPQWRSYPITVYRYEWTNPHPQKQIEAVSIHFDGSEGEIMLLALTGVRSA